MISTGIKKNPQKKSSLPYLLTTTIMLRTTVHQLFYLFLPSFPHRLYLLSSCVISIPSFPPQLSFFLSSLFSLIHSVVGWKARSTNQPTHPPERLIWRRNGRRKKNKKEKRKFCLFVGKQNRSRYAYLDTWTRMAVAWQFLEEKKKKKQEVFGFRFLFAGCLDRLVMLGLVLGGLVMVVVVCLFDRRCFC